MKPSASLGIATFTFFTCIAGLTLAQENIMSSSLPADKVQFGPTGIKTEIGELKAGAAYGDLTKGRHGTFLRIPAKYVGPLHSHTADYFGIVVQGVAGILNRATPTCRCPSDLTISKRARRTTSLNASPT